MSAKHLNTKTVQLFLLNPPCQINLQKTAWDVYCHLPPLPVLIWTYYKFVSQLVSTRWHSGSLNATPLLTWNLSTIVQEQHPKPHHKGVTMQTPQFINPNYSNIGLNKMQQSLTPCSILTWRAAPARRAESHSIHYWGRKGPATLAWCCSISTWSGRSCKDPLVSSLQPVSQ